MKIKREQVALCEYHIYYDDLCECQKNKLDQHKETIRVLKEGLEKIIKGDVDESGKQSYGFFSGSMCRKIAKKSLVSVGFVGKEK